MSFISTTQQYLREHQPPLVRFLHIIILFLILSQILVSNFMGFSASGQISENFVKHYGTWIHIITGLSLLPLMLLFVLIEFRRRNFAYFFAYLQGDFTQIKKDVQKIFRLKLPEAQPAGIAAIVQGLGLGAVVLVLVSGLIWFLTWLYFPSWAHGVKEIHETLTGLVEAYIIGHGGLGLIHLLVYWKQRNT